MICRLPVNFIRRLNQTMYTMALDPLFYMGFITQLTVTI